MCVLSAANAYRLVVNCVDDFEFVNKGGTILTWGLNHPRMYLSLHLSKTLIKDLAKVVIIILVHNNLPIGFLPQGRQHL